MLNIDGASVARDLLCFSHLRWNFVFQRPQHLLTRAAKTFRVHFFEEPIFEDCREARLERSWPSEGITVLVPVLPEGSNPVECVAMQRELLDAYLAKEMPEGIDVGWYYTPMSLLFSRHLKFGVCIYDCMDELTGFKGAPPELAVLERELIGRADLMFTGGQSLYEAKRFLHGNVHPFPSSVDADHFLTARGGNSDAPADVSNLPRPRLGYVGVIDERLDRDLLETVALARPDWQFVMIGPVVKVDFDSLPKLPNIHWLGGKTYAELPAYLASLDIAMMPFAINEATRFISPTKTPEYLAAGLPVVSTPVRDVVRTWGECGLVAIAETPDEMIAGVEKLLAQPDRAGWLERVDAKLALSSWDTTWAAMLQQIDKSAAIKAPSRLLAGEVNRV